MKDSLNISERLSTHFKSLFFGGNWSEVSLKELLSDVSWREAITQVDKFNSIAALVYHIDYFVAVTLKVLEGGLLDGHDKYSFDCPPIHTQADWDDLVNKVLEDARRFTDVTAELPEDRIWSDLADPKYGSVYSNIQGIIEHTYYHLGQISILKRIIR